MSDVQVTSELIRTPEDAVNMYLRGEIDEKGLRKALDSFGASAETLFSPAPALKTRVDAAFNNKIPDDLYDAAQAPQDNIKARLKVASDKEAARQKATKEAK